MKLIKTSLLNAIAVLIKMLTLLGINKVLAIFVGPAGYAAIGQFQNAMQMITTLASGAINTGVVKYTAEYHEDVTKQRAVWVTAGTIAFVGSVICSLLIVSFSERLAVFFLQDKSLKVVFLWSASTLTLFVFNTLLLSILNGKKEVSSYVIANIAGSLFAITIISALVAKFALLGALIALATYQSFSFLITLLLCYKKTWFKFSYFIGSIDRGIALNLSKYTMMALTSAICIPISHMFVRNYLGESFGWEFAGYWEAMWRLSAAYLLFVTSTLSVYFLPRLAELKKSIEIRYEILQGYKIVLPLVFLIGISIYLSRDFIIPILFSSEFLPMRDLFFWQILGDTLKIGSWILAYLMLGKALVKLYIISEILCSLCFVTLTIFFSNIVGFEGVSLAHLVTYLLYWIAMIYFIFYKYLDSGKR